MCVCVCATDAFTMHVARFFQMDVALVQLIKLRIKLAHSKAMLKPRNQTEFDSKRDGMAIAVGVGGCYKST